MTALYNVLAKLRGGEALTERERDIHDRGLISVLQRLRDDLDRAVFAAYGWPPISPTNCCRVLSR